MHYNDIEHFTDPRKVHSGYLHGASVKSCEPSSQPRLLTSQLVFDSLKDYYGENIVRLDLSKGIDKIIIGSSDTSVTIIKGSLILKKGCKEYSFDTIINDLESIKKAIENIKLIEDLSNEVKTLKRIIVDLLERIEKIEKEISDKHNDYNEKLVSFREELNSFKQEIRTLGNDVDELKNVPKEISSLNIRLDALREDFVDRVQRNEYNINKLRIDMSEIKDQIRALSEKNYVVMHESVFNQATADPNKIYFLVDA